MQKKFLIANLIFLSIIVILVESISFLIIKNKLGDFELETQGGTTMVRSFYQVWQHPNGYKSWSGKTEFNNQGFRRRDDLTFEKPEDVVRIFFMGGSAAFGSQAMPGSTYLQLSGQGEYSNEETITAYLESKLTEKYPHKEFQVINAATNWSRLHQQMLHYLRKIRNMEPDLILSMDAYNDSAGVIQESTWTDTESIGSDSLFGNLKHKISPIFQKSNTAYLLAMMIFRTGEAPIQDEALIKKFSAVPAPTTLDSDLGKSRIDHASILSMLVSEYTDGLKYFDAVLDQDGVPHGFYLQPLAILDQYKTLTPVEEAIRGYQFDTMRASQLIRINFFNDIEDIGERLKSDGIVNFESMLDVFEGQTEDIYSDYCHFTPRGNELLADYFLNEIETKYSQILK